MLKIKNVNLNSGITFLPGELEKLSGDATLKIATGEDATVNLCKGVFHMSNCGTGVMCSIQAAGKLTASGGYKDVNLENLSLELTNGKVVREYTVIAGMTTVNTGLGANLDSAKLNGVTVADDNNGTVTVFASAVSVDTKVKLELTITNIGTCEFVDENINHKFDIIPDNQACLVEFTALCNVNSTFGLRPNKVSLLFRGSNSWKVMGKSEDSQTVMLSASNAPFDNGYPTTVVTANSGEGGGE